MYVLCSTPMSLWSEVHFFLHFVLTQIAGWTIESGKECCRSRIKIVFGSSAWAGNIYIMKFYTISMAWNKSFKHIHVDKLHCYLGFTPHSTTQEERGQYITFFQVIWFRKRRAAVLNNFLWFYHMLE
jgi:hypothetical protein